MENEGFRIEASGQLFNCHGKAGYGDSLAISS